MLDPRALTPVLRVLAVCLHLLMAGLLVLAAVQALLGPSQDFGVVVAAVITGGVYAVGPASRLVHDSTASRCLWLGVLGAAWLGLLAVTPTGVWVAFPMFFVQLHLLPGRWGIAAVGLTTAAAIAGFGWHAHEFSAGTVLGPILGAAFAVATVRGYQTLHAESERRRQLIDELLAARDDLAVAERTAGTLAERDRLAREIHDTLAQGLSSIQLLLRAAERALPDAPETAAGHVRHARSAAQDNLAEARRFVHELSPPGLAEGSLASALERLCGSTEATTEGLTSHFEVTGEAVELSTQHEVTLLRIAQSALANTAKHAEANNLWLSLEYRGDGVTLRVADNGHGFRTEEGGFGLTTMRERATQLGGTLTVDTQPGQGTVLTVSIPLLARQGTGAHDE